MAKSNKKASFFEVTILTLVGLSFFLSIAPPLITPHFVSVNNYIDNSEIIEINEVTYIDREDVDIGASKNKDVFIIRSNDVYYGLTFYPEGTREHFSPSFSKNKVYERLSIRLNPIELDKHQGTIEDPIPVYNYGFAPDEFVWDAQKYEYNIKTHRVFEEILHTKSYDGILLFIIVIGIIPLGYFHFKPGPETIRRAKIKEAKKQRDKDFMTK